MNIHVDTSQIVTVLIGAALVQGLIGITGFLIFRSQASLWHEDNQKRFMKIEVALGIEDPDEVAFIRKSEADAAHKQINERLANHEGRIGTLEGRNK